MLEINSDDVLVGQTTTFLEDVFVQWVIRELICGLQILKVHSLQIRIEWAVLPTLQGNDRRPVQTNMCMALMKRTARVRHRLLQCSASCHVTKCAP